MAISNVVLLALVLTAAAISGINAGKISAVSQPLAFVAPDENKRSCSLIARIDMRGLRGTITFHQRKVSEPVTIVVNMRGLNQANDTRYGWHVHEYPVTFGVLRDTPCSQEQVGGHYDPLNRASSPSYANDCRNRKELCEVGDLAGKFGPLLSNRSMYTFTDTNLNLYRSYGIVGRSIVIHEMNGDRFACGNIDYDGNTRVDTYRAPFPNPNRARLPNAPLQGDIILKRPQGKAQVMLHAELYRIDGGPVNMPFRWSLRTGSPGDDGSCSNLGRVYGSGTHTGNLNSIISRCSMERQRSCFIGNLTEKCGILNINNSTRRIKHFCTDIQLGHTRNFLDRTSIAIEDSNGNVIACSRFQLVQPQEARASFAAGSGADRVFVNVRFTQSDPNEPTFAQVHTTGLIRDGSYYQVHQGDCSNIAAVFEPRPDFNSNLPQPLPPLVTGDLVPLGEFRNKWSDLTGLSMHRTIEVSNYMPLFGPFSIVGKVLVLHRATGVVWACGDIRRITPASDPNIPSILGYHIDE